MKKAITAIIVLFLFCLSASASAAKIPPEKPGQPLFNPNQEIMMIRDQWQELYATVIDLIKNEVAIRNNLVIMSAVLDSNDCHPKSGISREKTAKNQEEFEAEEESKRKNKLAIRNTMAIIDRAIDYMILLAARLEEVADKSKLFSIGEDFDRYGFVSGLLELNTSFRLDVINERTVEAGKKQMMKSEKLLAEIKEAYGCKK